MFNVDLKDFESYTTQFPDVLDSIAKRYSDFEKHYPTILFALNQHLKWFPVLNEWRITICWQWDACRISMICATATYRKHVEHQATGDTQNEDTATATLRVQYYLENVIFRGFAVLEKLSHMVAILFQVGIQQRDVSFARVRSKLNDQYPHHPITHAYQDFENASSSLIRELRNALTHRDDPLGQTWQMKDMEIAVKDMPADVVVDVSEPSERRITNDNDKLTVTVPIANNPILSVNQFFIETTAFYQNLTRLLENVLPLVLDELLMRLSKEEEEYKWVFD